MNVVVNANGDKAVDDGNLVQQSTELLKEVLGPSEGAVKAQWHQVMDEHGQPFYLLKISDVSEEAEAKFAPDELSRPKHMRIRLYDLWDKLLQNRGKKLMQQVRSGDIENSTLAQRFHELAAVWKKDTRFMSNSTKNAIHPAYQKSSAWVKMLCRLFFKTSSTTAPAIGFGPCQPSLTQIQFLKQLLVTWTQ